MHFGPAAAGILAETVGPSDRAIKIFLVGLLLFGAIVLALIALGVFAVIKALEAVQKRRANPAYFRPDDWSPQRSDEPSS